MREAVSLRQCEIQFNLEPPFQLKILPIFL
jgi:hypothetical protein